jgi:hypothetical protein
MKTLDSLLKKSLSDAYWREIANHIAERLSSRGIRMSARERRRLAKQLKSGDTDSLTFLIEDLGTSSEALDIELTDQELDKISEALLSKVSPITERLLQDLPPKLLDDLRARWDKESRRQRRASQAFRKRLREHWKEGLEKLAMQLTVARELGAGVVQEVRATECESPHLAESLIRLHARACQIATEVFVLLENGHADGAHARWRTLHEVTVTASFIEEGGEALAEKYLAHDAIESWRAAQDYDRCAARLGYPPLQPGELAEAEREANDAISKYGAAFTGAYGWAAVHLGKPRVGFETIEQAVSIDHLRAHYRMASHNVHANAKGLFFRLGLMEDSDILLAGASNAGLTDPGHATAIALSQISAVLVSLAPTLDTTLSAKILLQLADEVGDAFAEADHQLKLKHLASSGE